MIQNRRTWSRSLWLIIPVCAFVVVLTALLGGWSIFARLDPARPVTQAQIQQFAKTHQIQPLLVTTAGNDATIILYRNPTEMGYYGLWRGYFSSDPNDIGYQWVSTEDFAPAQNPSTRSVSVLASHVNNHEVIGVTINDPQLAQRVQSVEVTFQNGSKVKGAVANAGFVASRWTSTLTIPTTYNAVALYDNMDREVMRIVP